MSRHSWLTRALHTALAALFAGTLLTQVLTPILATDLGQEYPEMRGTVIPYSVAAILALVCVQVILIVIGHLVGLIGEGEIFTSPALRWVDVITTALGVATVLCAGLLVHMLGIMQVGGPGVVFMLMGVTAVGITLVLVVAVMRGLLHAAIADRDELAEVI